ncbi:hypothetical protein FDB55_11560 [Clostridium botulinum]|uniref:Uncharacterized protein n=1 Tax=Clostridium botulinum TaxID=1491 RepID=A0A0M1M183_CLOBO|nr:hypothetical protein [Clostridium botulinum]KAI3344572.1 hypothetical protein CIT18_17280 [Clostridium botulinum]KOM87715.1 hypothetical protein ACP51_11110 [Clostridium botulinum]KOR63642.1 hypothetical protein ADT22_02790 [Clostridium botulinum]MCS6112255.1 hypothetical protein [Clostridium botulinum]NFE13268.1 hypothetical protein [Clostridium botulinum]
MHNKNLNNKGNINNKLINIIVSISLIMMICMGIVSAIGWKKTDDFVFITSGCITILGILFNIYLFSRLKSK